MQEINNLLFLLFFTLLCVLFSFDSLRYHARKYSASVADLERFRQNLSPLLKVLYSRIIDTLIKDMQNGKSTQLPVLQFRRVLTAVLPCVLTLAAIVGFARVISSGEVMHLNYPLHIAVMLPVLFFSSRFGHRLKEKESTF